MTLLALNIREDTVTSSDYARGALRKECLRLLERARGIPGHGGAFTPSRFLLLHSLWDLCSLPPSRLAHPNCVSGSHNRNAKGRLGVLKKKKLFSSNEKVKYVIN